MSVRFIPAAFRRVASRVFLAALILASLAASAPPVRAPHGLVVSADALASGIGRDVLRRGGNAVDAAVATAFALAVTFPEAGNLGGGGFLLVRRADGQVFALDFRETAPRAIRPEHFLDASGSPVPQRTLRGGLAVATPGTVAGLWEAHRKWGRRPWSELVTPAARLAASGFPLTERQSAQIAERLDDFASDPCARAIFLRAGAAPHPGERFVQKDLARTLRRIASRGARGFYDGPVAQAVVATVRAAGGVLDEADLAAYRPVEREALVGAYRGHRVITFPPPSSGGIALLQMLGMLEKADLAASGPGSSSTVHRMVEVGKRAYADRARWLGDPDAVSVPTRALLDPGYLDARAEAIRDERATPSSEIAAGSPAELESDETTHLSTADAEGTVVALTTTLNSAFGAVLVASGTGVLLNDEMDDFAITAGAANQFGLTGGAANAIAPGKRPLSSMCPTIVERNEATARPLLVLGSAGGSTIITSVLQVLVGVVDHRMGLQEAVDAPRFHHQWVPDRLDHEERAFPVDVADALRARGQVLAVRVPIGHVPALGSTSDGAWIGAVDSRRGGAAAGY